jgi:hypothetical protein
MPCLPFGWIKMVAQKSENDQNDIYLMTIGDNQKMFYIAKVNEKNLETPISFGLVKVGNDSKFLHYEGDEKTNRFLEKLYIQRDMKNIFEQSGNLLQACKNLKNKVKHTYGTESFDSVTSLQVFRVTMHSEETEETISLTFDAQRFHTTMPVSGLPNGLA